MSNALKKSKQKQIAAEAVQGKNMAEGRNAAGKVSIGLEIADFAGHRTCLSLPATDTLIGDLPFSIHLKVELQKIVQIKTHRIFIKSFKSRNKCLTIKNNTTCIPKKSRLH